jgi:hypothetical protein
MPSPFPGMDPFLESHNFGSLHSNMITYTQEALQKQLPGNYYALTSERIWIDTSERFIEPDVFLTEETRKSKRKTDDPGAVATLTLTKPVIVTVPHDEHTEPYLDIYYKKGDKKRLVCTIEILSLSNKTPGQKGQKLYRRKQREVLARKIHLVEIDLLRAGNHTTAVALDWATHKTGAFDYHVCVRRYNRFEEFEVYPILMQEALPTIAIPLLPADGDIPLDLQAILQRAYEAGPYARSLDYRTAPIEPPLSAKQATWMRERLRGAGIRRKGS